MTSGTYIIECRIQVDAPSEAEAERIADELVPLIERYVDNVRLITTDTEPVAS